MRQSRSVLYSMASANDRVYTMSKKALLILHGKQAANQAVRDAVMNWRDQGHELAVRVTWEGGDAERYVQEALNNGFTTLIAGGGDGSVRDITQALMESKIWSWRSSHLARLTILPLLRTFHRSRQTAFACSKTTLTPAMSYRLMTIISSIWPPAVSVRKSQPRHRKT